MGFFGSCGYDISCSTVDVTPPTAEEIARNRAENEAVLKALERPEVLIPIKVKPVATVPTNKPRVKIGSLPRIPSWLLHLTLAIAAAGIVHLVIYFYGR